MWTTAMPPQPIPMCVIALVSICASTDIVSRRIPNVVIAIGLIASLVVQAWLHGPLAGGANWLAGVSTGFALLVPFYLVRGMAAGDVKLLMMIGTWVGPEMTFHIALATFLIGGAWSLVVTMSRGRTRQLLWNLWSLLNNTTRAGRNAGAMRYAPVASVGSLPYGVAIAAGTLGMLFAAAA
ncbi:prepilin peptidase [Trinickia sp. YCB016]